VIVTQRGTSALHCFGVSAVRNLIVSSIYKQPTVWTGNTYPIRAAIKKLGGKWDEEKKGWIVPALTMKERASVYSECNGLKGVNVESV